MDKYGLIGKNIGYSFSREFFNKKFVSEKIAATYHNFSLSKIDRLQDLLRKEKNLKGFNVTIPYKEKIIPFLDKIDREAQKIGAVNTVKISDGELTGYNTDGFGFMKAISPYLEKHHRKALILGTGGASKAIAHALKKLEIEFDFVSRKPIGTGFIYAQLSKEIIEEHPIIINCTPLGTFPGIEQSPDIPYSSIGTHHLLFDLTYNPPLSKFLRKGKQQGASVSNGEKMLEFQAEKAWEIWNSPEL